jgi:hypothetical protein
MATMSSRRMAAGGFGIAVLCCAATFALGGGAQAATTAYPAGGSTFDGDPQGWTGSGASCGPLNPLALLCSASNSHDAGVGDPPGSIATNVTVTLNLLSVFTGTGTWTSPPFEVSAPSSVTAAAFSYERRVDAGGGPDLTPTSNVEVVLVDETAGTTTPILTELLTNADSAFTAQGAPVPAAAIVDGHSYRLRIATTTTSSVAGLLGQANTRFDNVGLTVQTAGPDLERPGTTPGGDTPLVSPGVQIRRGPYSNSEFTQIVNRFGLNAERGSGEGGSLVPIELCTVVGTAGRDRIVGTNGNDVICGLGGNDVIVGASGRDLVDGGDGADRINGSAGRDKLLALAGNDRVGGDGAADGIGGGAGRDIVGGAAGADRISARSGADRVSGGSGGDRIAGGAGRDVLNGGSGRDRIAGGGGADRLVGGPGRDRLLGGGGNDRLRAVDAVRDSVRGGPARDRAAVDRRDRVASVWRVTRRG